MYFRYSILQSTLLLFLTVSWCSAQQLLPLSDADSMYIRKFPLVNEIRIFYGLQGNNLSLGSTRDDGTKLNGDLYKNSNDLIGIGGTYGWLDGDLTFSLPGTTYMKEERSNLTQFKLALNHTRRKWAYRLHYIESTGMVISDSYNTFESSPSIHEVRYGLQITHIFNSSRYSYRASLYQSEFQMKTASSFLLRFEPFFRKLGSKDGSMIPTAYDLESRFGEQAGLEYIHSPGVLVMPGYGINIVLGDPRFFISPIVFAGVGLAHNMYKATSGKDAYTSLEYASYFMLNAGYNGKRSYYTIQVNWTSGYTSFSPTYLTNANLRLMLTCGYRLGDFLW